jgi:hypothetical protein
LAFASPFLDASAKEVFISKCFLICPHEISQVTLAIIKEELREFKDNLTVIDGPELFTLLQQYYPDYKPDEFTFKAHRLSEFRKDVQEDHALAKLASNQLHMDAYRDAYTVYVQPAFEATLTNRGVDAQAILRGVLPEQPRTLQVKETPPSEGIVPVKPRVYLVTPPYIAQVRQQKLNLQQRIAVFLKTKSVAEESFDAVLRQFEKLLSFLDTAYYDKEGQDTIIAPLRDSYGDRLIIPREEHTALSEAQTSIFLEHLTAARNAVSGLVASINQSFSADFERLLTDSTSERILERDSFQRMLFLSDYFSINPNPYVVNKEVHRLQVETTSFHGSCRSVFIVGPAGYGKTSFCRWHTLEDDKLYSKKAHQWIAVYVPLHKLRSTQLSSLSHTIKEHAVITRNLFGRSEAHRKAAGYRVYLDGLDEVNDELARSRILELVKTRKQLGCSTAYVLTSRDYLVGEETLGIPRLSISPLSDEKISELARLWLHDESLLAGFTRQLNEVASLRELARIPILCTLTILIYKKTRSIPENKLKLYETFIELLSSGWDLAKGVQRETSHKAEFKMLVLRRIGLCTHLEQQKTFTRRHFFRVLGELRVNFTTKEMEMLLNELLSDGVIQKSGSDYEFGHLSFQEYLAALELFNDPDKETADSCLASFLGGDQWWKDVMQFYVLMIRSPLSAMRWIEGTRRAQELRGETTRANADYLERVARMALTAT